MAVVALLTDVALRLRVVDAFKGASSPVECVAHARDARARLAAGDVRLFVVGPRDAGEHPSAPLVAEVRRQLPSVTVVAYCAVAGSSEDILALVRAGAHSLVVRGVDDERYAFRAALRAAEQRCTAELVFDRVREQLPAAVTPLVALYLRADGEPPSVAEAAELLGVHRKTLVNRLAAAGCPTPRVLRTWCRLFVASRLLEEPGRTVESIALQLDFESTTGLRNALKRYTGHGAGAIRAAGGLAHVLAHFNAACAAHRPGRAATAGVALRTSTELPSSDPAALPARGAAGRRTYRRAAASALASAALQALAFVGAWSLDLPGLDEMLFAVS